MGGYIKARFNKIKGIALGAILSGVLLTGSAAAYDSDGGSSVEINLKGFSAGLIFGAAGGGGVGTVLWKMSNTKKKARDANQNIVPGASRILYRELGPMSVSKRTHDDK